MWISCLVARALGAEPVLDDAGVSEDVVVTAPRKVSEAKEALHDALRAQRYVRLLRWGERSWYLNMKIWKPGVMLHDQGFVRIRTRAFTPIAIAPTANSLHVTGVVQGRRERWSSKAKLATYLEPHLRALRDAHWAQARPHRELELVDELVGLWFEGHDRAGHPLPDRRAIRGALLDRWLHTATGEPGAWVRSRIERFVEAHVQTSDHPFTSAELDRFLARMPPDRDPPQIARATQDPQEPPCRASTCSEPRERAAPPWESR